MSWEDDEFDVDLNDPKNFSKGTGFSDEEDDDGVKDAWDADSDSEKTDKNPDEKKPVAVTVKKKNVKQRIAEKEAQKKAEQEEKMRKAELEAAQDPEEEKRQRQMLVELADLDIAKDLFGGSGVAEKKVKKTVDDHSIDNAKPRNRADFDKFGKDIAARIREFENTPFYVSMIEYITKEISTSLDYEDTRKVAQALNVAANDKQRQEKEKKKGGGKKKKGPSVKMERGGDDDGSTRGRFDTDMDDFM